MSAISQEKFDELINFLNLYEPSKSDHVINLNDMDETHIVRRFCGLNLVNKKKMFKKYAKNDSVIDDDLIVYDNGEISISISTFIDDDIFEFSHN